jgi:hypothetical protein
MVSGEWRVESGERERHGHSNPTVEKYKIMMNFSS